MRLKKIEQSTYRMLFSDVLPYEIPLFMSNERFFHLANRLHLAINDKGEVVYRKSTKNEIQNLWAEAFKELLNGTRKEKISFNYYINKDNVKHRELVIIHPYVQLKMMDFYKRYDCLITNFCRQSHFSIRYPDKRATFVKPRRLYSKTVEELNDYKANENPKHYFHYLRYQNINAFYEGSEFQRYEKKFSHIFRTDIRHCFDSVPIERLSEIIYGLDKNNEGFSFANELSSMMMSMNHKLHADPQTMKRNTKGIVIGPEFSRIVSEIILQQFDKKIEKIMQDGITSYKFHKDYECCRYVDDIFFFYNDYDVYSRFYDALRRVLRTYNMEMSKDKTFVYELPMVSKETIAKRELKKLIETIFFDRLNSVKGLIKRNENDTYDFPYKIKSKYIITDIKTILYKTGVDFNKISASILSYLHRKLASSLDYVDGLMDVYREANSEGFIDDKGKRIWIGYEKGLVYFLREIIKILFYFFDNDMRMSTSIKVLTILDMIVSYCKGKLFDDTRDFSMELSSDSQIKIYKSIVDELSLILKYNKVSSKNGLEICNLLLILKSIPKIYKIDESVIREFLGNDLKSYKRDGAINTLTVLTLLMVIENDADKKDIHKDAVKWLMACLEDHEWSIDDTESFMIIINLVTSPYVNEPYKDEIAKNLPDNISKAVRRINMRLSPFVKWNNFNLTKECLIRFPANVY